MDGLGSEAQAQPDRVLKPGILGDKNLCSVFVKMITSMTDQ
jgi:hypothetical protein